MAYSPENNPYIPGDPYSYDLKWIVAKLKLWGDAATAAERAEAAAKIAVESSAMYSKVFTSPENFGAKGDGVTDDTEAFTEALAQGLPVQLQPAATYLLSEIEVPKDATIYGNGAILKRKAGNVKLLSIPNDNVHIENVIIDGNRSVDVGNFSGIDITGNKCHLDHIIIRECRNNEDAKAGIFINGSKHTRLSNIIAYDNDKSAIYFSDCDSCIVEKVLAYNNGGSGITSARTSNTIYKDIDSHDNGYSCVSVNGDNCVVMNIEVYNSGFAGLNLGHNTVAGGANDCAVYNVYAHDNTQEGLSIQNSKDVKIYNSRAEKNIRNNSRLWYSSTVYYENCIFSNSAAGAGILVTSGSFKAVHCRFEYNAVGISITQGQSGIADDCEFIDNTTYHAVFDRVLDSGVNNSKITSASAPLANAMIIANSANVSLINNTITGTSEALLSGTNTGLKRFNDTQLTEGAKKIAFNLTAGANVTITRQFNYRVGNMIFGSVSLAPTAAIGGGVVFATIPLAAMGISVNNGFMASLFGRWNGNAAGYANSIQVSSNGELSQTVGTMSSDTTFIYMMMLAD